MIGKLIDFKGLTMSEIHYIIEKLQSGRFVREPTDTEGYSWTMKGAWSFLSGEEADNWIELRSDPNDWIVRCIKVSIIDF